MKGGVVHNETRVEVVANRPVRHSRSHGSGCHEDADANRTVTLASGRRGAGLENGRERRGVALKLSCGPRTDRGAQLLPVVAMSR